MSEPASQGASTRVSAIIKAPRQAVYQAFLDPNVLASWRAPGNMKGHVHHFEPREGGSFRISLVYADPTGSPGGKTAPDRDTYHGRFVKLAPDEEIVEVIAFESPAPEFAGEMTITTRLTDARGGTEVTVICENLPVGVRPADNEMGTRLSLQKLAALLE